MPIVPQEQRLDCLRRKVLISRNIRAGWLVDLAMGGLNYEIEHHLFPSRPRANLRRARPIVRAFCQERGIPYAGIPIRLLPDRGPVPQHRRSRGR